MQEDTISGDVKRLLELLQLEASCRKGRAIGLNLVPDKSLESFTTDRLDEILLEGKEYFKNKVSSNGKS